MVSGFLHGSLLPLARHLGAVAVLQKPLDPDTLLLTVCDILTTA
jgi:hypothetical protein